MIRIFLLGDLYCIGKPPIWRNDHVFLDGDPNSNGSSNSTGTVKLLISLGAKLGCCQGTCTIARKQ